MITGARVYVNGEIVGHHDDPRTLVSNLRRLRRSGSISSQMNVAYFEDTNEIFMNTDSGRARRPLIVVEDGKARVTEEHVQKVESGELKFSDLVAGGLVEYLDAEEEENTLIAISGDHGAPGFPHGKCNLYGFGTGVSLSIAGPGVTGPGVAAAVSVASSSSVAAIGPGSVPNGKMARMRPEASSSHRSAVWAIA